MTDNTETTAETTQETQTTNPNELTLVDLQNIRTIIDVSSRRGAFAAGEMAAIGAVYNKLDAFLNAVIPASTEATGTEENT